MEYDGKAWWQELYKHWCGNILYKRCPKLDDLQNSAQGSVRHLSRPLNSISVNSPLWMGSKIDEVKIRCQSVFCMPGALEPDWEASTYLQASRSRHWCLTPSGEVQTHLLSYSNHRPAPSRRAQMRRPAPWWEPRLLLPSINVSLFC